MTDFTGRRILVVDDEGANRRLIQAILAPVGVTIVQAADGAAALAILRQAPIDLVLLDVMMPGLDGIEVCRLIRDRAHGDYIPVVLVTALTDGASRARGAAAGADDFLTKPVHQDELVARARNLLRLRAYHELVERQHRDAEAEARRWRLTAEVAGAVAICRDYDGLLQQMQAALAPSVPFDCACVLDAEGGHLLLKAVRGGGQQVAEPPRLPWDEQAWAERACEGLVHVTAAGGGAGPVEPIAGLLRAFGYTEAVAISVFGAGALRGLFVVARLGAFCAAEVATLGKLAPHIGNAVDDVRLHVRAEHLLRAREELSQLIVHDLQNPLSAAGTNLELALDDGVDEADRLEILRDARRALQRATALVSDLLDTSAAEEGRLRLDPRPTDLIAMCGAIAAQAAPRFGAAYEIRLAGAGPVHACVDRKLLYRVLENIVGNATRYVTHGGRVEIGAARRGEQVVLAVANDGPTLSPEVRARLFQKYAGDPRSGRTRGLGLYFCRLVVEAHGGTIREAGPEGGVGGEGGVRGVRGVRFEICLPAGAAASRPAARGLLELPA